MIDKGINVKKIDLSGVSFPTSDASTCALIYTAVRNTYGFPLYLTNFKINDEKRDSVLVSPIILTDSVVINLGDYYLTISATAITATAGVINVDGAVSTPILTSPNDHIEAQKPVIEVMTGYSMSILSVENYTIEGVYGGVVKNGNKLTIVLAVNITKNVATNAGGTIAELSIPANIWGRLYPTLIGTYSFLDVKDVSVFSDFTSSKIVKGNIEKDGSNAKLYFNFTSTSDLVVGTKYYYRHEATFLLSDNLVA